MTRSKIAIIVQGYGAHINGGAEQHARLLAELMTMYKDVDVLTCQDEYFKDPKERKITTEKINGVLVRRFPREMKKEDIAFGDLTIDGQVDWLKKQGPYIPKLVDFLKEKKEEYEAFIFFTYLFYPTVAGLPQVKEKAIFIPLAHSEDQLDLNIFSPIFNMPRAFFFNTEVEKDLVRCAFRNYGIPYKIGGVAIDVPEDASAERAMEKFGINSYILYLGRITDAKNVSTLVKYFKKFKKEKREDENLKDLKLVLAGKKDIEIEEDSDIVLAGFVDETDKFDLIAGCKLLVQPSKFESLSMVLLESFAMKKPVIVNEECDVLKNHIIKSQGGEYFRNYKTFASALKKLVTDENYRLTAGEKGFEYVNDNYSWDVICKKLLHLIEDIKS